MGKDVCAYSRRPLCNGCRGPVYECDPRKNICCTKEFCGICRYTHDPQNAKDPSFPECARVLENSEKLKAEQTREINKRLDKIANEIKNIEKRDRPQFISYPRMDYIPIDRQIDHRSENPVGIPTVAIAIIASMIATIAANLLLR